MIAALFAALIVGSDPPPASPFAGGFAEAIAAAEAQGPLAPDAQRQLETMLGQVDAARARHAAEGPASSLAVELRRRAELDQLPRRFEVDPRLPDKDRLEELRGALMIAIDEDNTAWLKSVLPADGWFRKSRDGEQVVDLAWRILIHSPDDAWIDQVLARMEPLARLGEVDAGAFANRYDRVEVLKGRPQRYGTAATCVKGYKDFYPIADRAGVEARRRALRLGPLAVAARNLNVGNWCGGAAFKPRSRPAGSPPDAAPPAHPGAAPPSDTTDRRSR